MDASFTLPTKFNTLNIEYQIYKRNLKPLICYCIVKYFRIGKIYYLQIEPEPTDQNPKRWISKKCKKKMWKYIFIFSTTSTWIHSQMLFLCIDCALWFWNSFISFMWLFSLSSLKTNTCMNMEFWKWNVVEFSNTLSFSYLLSVPRSFIIANSWISSIIMEYEMQIIIKENSL